MPKLNRRPRVYVAGPYSKPDPCVNTRDAILAGDRLWELGFAPFVPHLTHLWHTVSPKPYTHWLDYDNQFLPCCDAVFRLPGLSGGADAEVRLAQSLGIPVFEDEEDLLTYFGLTPPASA